MKTSWDFVETYYPDYYRSEEITLSNDLVKIITKEWEEGDSSHTLLIEEYNNDPTNPHIMSDYSEVMRIIYKKSINNYLKNLTK